MRGMSDIFARCQSIVLYPRHTALLMTAATFGLDQGLYLILLMSLLQLVPGGKFALAKIL